jgi:hypothetical protein
MTSVKEFEKVMADKDILAYLIICTPLFSKTVSDTNELKLSIEFF